MSKDFEQAYRELAESEIPDLWERIEAGLESKSTPQHRADRTPTRGAQEGSDTEREKSLRSLPDGKEALTPIASEKKKTGRRFGFSSLRSVAGIAAAALCVTVILPAAFVLLSSRGLRMGRAGGTGATEGIDMAAADSMDMESAPEICEAMPENAAKPAREEGAVDDAADAGGAAGTAGADGADTADAGAAGTGAADTAEAGLTDAGEMDAGEKGTGDRAGSIRDGALQAGAAQSMQDSDAGQAGGIQESSKRKEESKATADASDEAAATESEMTQSDAGPDFPAEGAVFEHVVIRVEEITNDFERQDGSPPGILYTVTVLRDDSGQLGEGRELMVDLPAWSSLALVKDEAAEVDLIYNGNETFGVKKLHGQARE